MAKRGLSDIITTVLIILLAIAAVVLIWSFIKRPVEQGGQQIQTSTACLSLKLVPTACTLNLVAKTAAVTVQWTEGTGLQKMKVIVTDGSGLNNVSEVAGPTSVLGTAQATVDVSGLSSAGLSASAIGEVQQSDGSLITCTASTQETIACK